MNNVAEAGFWENRGIEADLSNPGILAGVLQMFGGEEYMAVEYPSIYNLVKNTQKKKKKAVNSKEGFRNSAFIVDIIYDKKSGSAYAAGHVYLTQKAQWINCMLAIYLNDEKIGISQVTDFNLDSVVIECNTKPFEEPTKEANYRAELYAVWQPYGCKTIQVLHDEMLSEKITGIGEEFVKELIVDDPAYKKSNEGPIRVALIRTDPNVDYDYPNAGRDDKGNVNMELKIGGKATVADNHYIASYPAPSINALLNQEKVGSIFYLNPDISDRIKISNDKMTITWDLDENWYNSVPQSVAEGNRDYYFDMMLEFYCGECHKMHQLVVSSYDHDKYNQYLFYKKIPKVNILWGCLAEGTMISMDDGSKKPIENIMTGDILISDNGRPLKVSNVVTGTEDTIYHLKLESGEEVLATIEHPFMSFHGLIRVADIDSSTKLLNEKGDFVRVYDCYPEKYGRKVYSIETEDYGLFFANGIASGLHSDQGKLANKVDEDLGKIDPDIEKEIEKLKKTLMMINK